MRVLAVTPWFPSAKLPGSGLFNLRDVELLAQEHEVTVLHLIAPANLSPEEVVESTILDGKVRVIRQPFATANPRLLLRAKKAIQAYSLGVDLVHTMAMPALLPVRVACLELPWVHTEHFSRLVTQSSSWLSEIPVRLLAQLFSAPTETVAVSVSLARVIDTYRERPSTVIGNEVMEPVGEIPGNLDPGGPVQLIGVGGIIARKGPIEAVETVAELVGRGVDARLIWVGQGELRDVMLARAVELGIPERLRLTGQLTPDELSRELLASNVFLLPVETETFGVAIAEAMRHGLPVVVTGTGGHEEFLVPEASRLVAQRSARPLADAVQDLISSPGLWHRQRIALYADELFSGLRRKQLYAEVYNRASADFARD